MPINPRLLHKVSDISDSLKKTKSATPQTPGGTNNAVKTPAKQQTIANANPQTRREDFNSPLSSSRARIASDGSVQDIVIHTYTPPPKSKMQKPEQILVTPQKSSPLNPTPGGEEDKPFIHFNEGIWGESQPEIDWIDYKR